MLRAYDSLSLACERARSRPRHTIAAILGLEGLRYYVFFSQPSLEQYMRLHVATRQIRVAVELEHHVGRLAPDQAHGTTLLHHVRHAPVGQRVVGQRDRLLRLSPLMLQRAQARGARMEAGHAESFMIKSWRKCLNDFSARTSRRPKKAEVFLTGSPCRVSDNHPSEEMIVDGRVYPVSCQAKLYTFFKWNHTVQWRVWYLKRFGAASTLTDAQLVADFPGIAIRPVAYSNSILRRLFL